MSAIRLTPEQKAKARELRALGWSYLRISSVIGCAPESLRRHCDPTAAARIRDSRADETPEPKRKAGRQFVRNIYAAARADFEARIAEIPPDTRDLTGRLMGDPIPGRRAIDKVGK